MIISLSQLKFKILTRYLVRHFLYRFFILSLGILSLVFLITFVEMMRKIDDNSSLSLGQTLFLSFSQLPPVIDKIFPFLILLSSLWSIFSLLKTSELIILKVSSFSLQTIASIYFFTSFILAIIYIFVLMPVLAEMHHEYRHWENSQNHIIQNIHKKIITSENKTVFFTAQELNLDNHYLKNIHINFLDNDGLVEKTAYASKGYYNENQKTILFETINFLQSDTAMIKPESKIDNYLFTINLNTMKIYDNSKQIITSIYEYPFLITTQKEQKLSTNNLYVLFYSLLVLPLTCGIYSFISIVSVPSLYRGFKTTKNIMSALLSGLLFYIIDNWIMAVAGNGILPLLMALLTIKIPVILFCIIIIFNKEYAFIPQKAIS